ncbi:chemotaxis protein CheB [Colwellia sp. C1TZA3]|uniref:chemotaxis protein CheB n=1 Tax=Colwellia sp. C1TZA3 TaxID=2508879 RepID=UPI0011B9A4C3|nr:chemotaxis protein CheB [Colwellia sp. C1TZA3]TWX73508.1 chemotaxis protein CheB [Colwellia sp. C1TZA3]
MSYRAIVIGGSSGSYTALSSVLGMLPADFSLPIIIVLHLHPTDSEGFAEHLGHETPLTVIEPCDKQMTQPGCVYTVPANYHMLLERDGSIALSVDKKVNWSRPSIDVLFESAACAWQAQLIAVLLSGANCDGMQGMLAVQQAGGYNIAQDPTSTKNPVMPQAAITAGAIDEVLSTQNIAKRLIDLAALEHCAPKPRSLASTRLLKLLPKDSRR